MQYSRKNKKASFLVENTLTWGDGDACLPACLGYIQGAITYSIVIEDLIPVQTIFLLNQFWQGLVCQRWSTKLPKLFFTMAQIIWSRGRPVELLLDVHQILLDVQQNSTGRPLEFCKFASNVLKLLNSSRNAIKISTGCPVEFLDIPQNLLDFQQNCSTGRPLEQNIWRNDLYFGSKHRYDNACCFFHH